MLGDVLVGCSAGLRVSNLLVCHHLQHSHTHGQSEARACWKCELSLQDFYLGRVGWGGSWELELCIIAGVYSLDGRLMF